MSRLRGGTLLASVAIFFAMVVYWPLGAENERERSLGRTARTFEGRPGGLDAQEWHAPFQPNPDTVSPRAEAERLFELEEQLKTSVRGDFRSELLAARGLLYLRQGKVADALVDLKSAVDQEPTGAAHLTDLAVALLARHRSGGLPTDLLLALEALQKALQLEPDSDAAQFNMALVLGKLGLRHQARVAWEIYLEKDPSSPWSEEARAHQATVSAPDLASRWEETRARIAKSGRLPTQAELESLVALYPLKSRAWGEEELLGAWARQENGAEAERILGVLRPLGKILAEKYRSPMLLDSLSALDDARMKGQTRRLGLLARGHRAYFEAMAAYNVQNMATAEAHFLAANTAFEEADSPFRHWARFYLGLCWYYGQSAQGGAVFSELLGDVPERYGDLRGRISWMLGTVAVVQDQPEVALKHYQKAFELLQESIGDTGSGFVHLVKAEALGRLGEIDASWEERVAALQQVSGWGDPRRLHSTLVESVQMLLRQKLGALAAPFLDELAYNATTWGNATAETEAHLQRARVELELRAKEASSATVMRARNALAKMPASKLRNHLQTSVDAEAARILARQDPGAGIRQLSEAIARQEGLGYNFDFIRLVTARAQAHLAQGARADAEQDFEQAISAYEKIRGGVGDELLRMTAFSQAQPAFESYLELLVAAGEPPERTFALAERARTRFLLDLRQEAARSQDPIDPVDATALERLPEGTRVLMYAVLKKRLLLWFADGKELRFHALDLAEETLEAKVTLLRNRIEDEQSEADIEVAALDLARDLLGPFADRLPGTKHLIFIPDRFLQRVPFMAMPNPATGRLLIEDFPISVSPSATLLLERRPDRSTEAAPKTALVIGEPAIDKDHFANLDPLPGALREATKVAAIYPGSLLLTSEDATEAALLEKMDTYDILHFAGHAQANTSSIRRSRLLLAPSPGEDGMLHAFELPRRFERTQLVVLSACRTLDSTSRDREDLLGLASTFLAAGVSTVVASLWDANDKHTLPLMVRLHRLVAAGTSPEEALRSSALAAVHGGRPTAVWASFQPTTSIGPCLF